MATTVHGGIGEAIRASGSTCHSTIHGPFAEWLLHEIGLPAPLKVHCKPLVANMVCNHVVGALSYILQLGCVI